MSNVHPFFNWLSDRLQQPLPGKNAHQKMIHKFRDTPSPFPPSARQSAVLFAIYTENDKIMLVMIERTKKEGSPHSGQIALPGGKVELDDASLWDTALRESKEEVDLSPQDVKYLGALTPIYIPVSNFVVHPFLGFLESLPVLAPSDGEVHKIIHASIDLLIAQQIKVKVNVPAAPGGIIETSAYKIDDERFVWGATAMMFAELEMLYEEYKTTFLDTYSI